MNCRSCGSLVAEPEKFCAARGRTDPAALNTVLPGLGSTGEESAPLETIYGAPVSIGP